MTNIISDLFDLARCTSGNLPVVQEQIDLRCLVMQTVADLENQINVAARSLCSNLPEETMPIVADGKYLYRVFQNLIENALKYLACRFAR